MVATKRKRDSTGTNATPRKPREKTRRFETPDERDDRAVTNKAEDAEEADSSSAGEVRRAVIQDENQFKVYISHVSKGKAMAPRKVKGGVSNPVLDEKPADSQHLGVWFAVSPGQHWDVMTKYRNFLLPSPDGSQSDVNKFMVGDFVFINHQLQALEEDSDSGSASADRSNWVAQVREVRALSADAVFVRVAWMYWPEELPNGRQLYHGRRELIASNHMDIVDAMTVDGKVAVVHLEQGTQKKERDMSVFGNLQDDTYYWRQTFNVAKGVGTDKISRLPKDCVCNRITNLDEKLLRCPHDGCRKWFHERCLVDATLKKYRARNAPNALGAEDQDGHVGLPGTPNDGSQTKEKEDEIQDTIVATPKQNGTKLSTITDIFFGTKKPKANGTSSSPAVAEAASPFGRKKRTAAREKTPQATSARDFKVELIFEGGVFTGKAHVRDVAQSESSLDPRLFSQTVEVECLNKKCGKSFATGDSSSAVEKVGQAVKVAYDAVRDAAVAVTDVPQTNGV